MIRLLHVETYTFPNEEHLRHQQRPPYVIISHSWGDQEVIYDDMPEFKEYLKNPHVWKKANSAAKVTGACKKVLQHYKGDIKHIWLDTVCINKKDPAEVSTSINSCINGTRMRKFALHTYMTIRLRVSPSSPEADGLLAVGLSRSWWHRKVSCSLTRIGSWWATKEACSLYSLVGPRSTETSCCSTKV